jgi:hypothetical protein
LAVAPLLLLPLLATGAAMAEEGLDDGDAAEAAEEAAAGDLSSSLFILLRSQSLMRVRDGEPPTFSASPLPAPSALLLFCAAFSFPCSLSLSLSFVRRCHSFDGLSTESFLSFSFCCEDEGDTASAEDDEDEEDAATAEEAAAAAAASAASVPAVFVAEEWRRFGSSVPLCCCAT